MERNRNDDYVNYKEYSEKTERGKRTSRKHLRTKVTPDFHLTYSNQCRTNGPINAHLTIVQVMPRYNHNNEKQEALL